MPPELYNKRATAFAVAFALIRQGNGFLPETVAIETKIMYNYSKKSVI